MYECLKAFHKKILVCILFQIMHSLELMVCLKIKTSRPQLPLHPTAATNCKIVQYVAVPLKQIYPPVLVDPILTSYANEMS